MYKALLQGGDIAAENERLKKEALWVSLSMSLAFRVSKRAPLAFRRPLYPKSLKIRTQIDAAVKRAEDAERAQQAWEC